MVCTISVPRGAVGQFPGFSCGRGFEGKSEANRWRGLHPSEIDSLFTTHEKKEKKYSDFSESVKIGEVVHPLF
jgi:hypothetical protein